MTTLISDEAFVREFGSYLCGVRHGLPAHEKRPGTCSTCAAPLIGDYAECWQCHQNREKTVEKDLPFPIDEIAFLTYAVEGHDVASVGHEREGRQAYNVLKGYKAQPPPDVYWRSMVMWVVWFLQRWWPDGDKSSTWMWATVPSRKSDRPGEHPLHKIVHAVLPDDMTEAVLRFTGEDMTRGFDQIAYSAAKLPDHRQVLLAEDLWVTGGNVLSAAAALKAAGATNVSALVFGRALKPEWSPSRQFIEHDGLRLGFEPGRPPWVKVRQPSAKTTARD